MARNLIVVVFDTLRYDAVFGDLARMPRLRRFAEQAATFTNAWGEGLPTIPFRRALHTGIRSFPWRYHVGDRGSFPNIPGWHAIPEAHTTAAEYLYNRGYATQLIADVWHMFKASQNFIRGFASWDFVRGQEGDTWQLGADSLSAASGDGQRIGPAAYLYQVRNRVRDDDYFVAQVFDRASSFIHAIQGADPYCLWIESFSPHEFWDPPLRFANEYFDKPGLKNYIVPQLLNRRGPQVQAQRGMAGASDAATASDGPSADDIARTKALYQGYCTFCDERFGRFLDTLEQTGALNNSVVAVLSDHGTEVWDKGQFGKAGSRLYPYNTHINLMVRHPEGEGAGKQYDAFVQNQDILPTLLDLLDIPHPRLDGASLWPLVTGTSGVADLAARDHVVIGWDVFASVRDREWNLLVNTAEPERDLRLFHLPTDPTESTNVAADNPQVVTRQIGRLEALLGAPLPAVYQHRPLRSSSATPGGLRQKRSEVALPGERWIGSNQA
ncbi:MAG: sulfatase-like hydrolase/transferase [Chloroflexi bacterium]|nr:sulfatase-like hydrolase/transferase [Chloroflexota bacterium]